MADLNDFPDPTAVEGAPHPRETERLIGQERAEAQFLSAYNTGRLHHGWMITGPRGIGKATLAWRIARFLLATPEDDGGFFAPEKPRSLDIDPEHPVARRILAGSESRVLSVRRGMNESGSGLAAEIRVDMIRQVSHFLHMSAADGGRRVVVIDSADEMNTNAANALLKLLEEPPARVTFLLVSHRPDRLLPTIRSRVRELRAAPLSPVDLAEALALAGADPDEVAQNTDGLAALAAGSVGEALRLVNLGGLRLYADLVKLLSTLPNLDRPAALTLAESVAGKAREAQFDLMLGLMDLLMTRLARAGVTGPPAPEAAPHEARLFARLSPDHDAAVAWAQLQNRLSARARHGRAVNLDPSALVMDMFLEISALAR